MKSIAMATGTFLLVVSSAATVAQTPTIKTVTAGQIQSLPNVSPLFGGGLGVGGVIPPDKLCNQTGGLLLQVMDAVKAGASTVYCQCPAGTKFYAPSGGCVKPGVGSLPQTNQPAKRMN